MYLDLYKGLGLKVENFSKYNTPLVGFDGRMVVPEGQISLPINTEVKEVMVNFIVVNSFLPTLQFSVGPRSMLWVLYRPPCM